ncbi:hypothetical protein SAMN05216205_1254 [Pseudomonas mohnii]|uniref:Uncharacterized protein n=1 Tax=Pseudomonas mohnii TaxID=395600 RepID=A0ABY0XS06_9PSED|nr:phage scaffolding protein [Pseudomonas mohnii]SEC02162.1 hypothetical protein SAMN05216205_1254 [Pseudomonas mohnii]
MSEVHRYNVVTMLSESGNRIGYDPHGPAVVMASDFDRVTAERDGLQLSLTTADQTIDDLQAAIARRNQRIEELERDKDRLDAIEANFWDVRHHSDALADTGDYTSSIEIVGQWMDKPNERVIGENYSENLRAAIDQAMTAPAYPRLAQNIQRSTHCSMLPPRYNP